jgi:hypothetical protein
LEVEPKELPEKAARATGVLVACNFFFEFTTKIG